jgi:hypothetical protein
MAVSGGNPRKGMTANHSSWYTRTGCHANAEAAIGTHAPAPRGTIFPKTALMKRSSTR